MEGEAIDLDGTLSREEGTSGCRCRVNYDPLVPGGLTDPRGGAQPTGACDGPVTRRAGRTEGCHSW